MTPLLIMAFLGVMGLALLTHNPLLFWLSYISLWVAAIVNWWDS